MNPAPPANRTRRWIAGVSLAVALVLVVWWRLRAAPPPAVPPPSASPSAPLSAPPAAAADVLDPATTQALSAWREALNADQWPTANRIEDEIAARGDAAVPNLEAEFQVAPDAARLPVTVMRQQRLAALLGRINRPAAVAALTRLLATAPPAEVRGQLLLALAGTADPFEAQVAPQLFQALENRDEPEATRSSVAILLARRGHGDSRRQLIAWAQSPPAADPALGEFAIAALAYARDAAAAPHSAPAADAWRALLAILQTDPAPARRAAAAAALGHTEQPAAVEPLIAALNDAALPVRRAAVAGLAALPPSPAGESALARLLQTATAEPGLRALAAKGLGRPHGDANLPALRAALQPAAPGEPVPPIYVQLKIVEAIEHIGGDAARGALQAIAEGQPPTVVKSAATAAAERLHAASGPAAPAPPAPGNAPTPEPDF